MMPGFDVLIRGGEVVNGDGRAVLDVGVTGERVTALLAPGSAATAEREIDATGLLVMPGGIDTHTHVAWPFDGTVTVDDWYSATRAAALGGTTTIIDFVPPGGGGLTDRCRARVEEAAAGATVDFGFHPILTPADARALDEIGQVVAEGFTSFKMYTTYEDRRVDDGNAWTLMRAIAAHGGLPGFHAENHEILACALDDQVRSGRLSLADYPHSRPGLAEAETIQMVSMYARRLNTPVYIFHVSGSDALDAVRAARRAGTAIHAETCTHYLAHDESVFHGQDAWRFVISPPIRTAGDQLDLWSGVCEGTVVSVGSDHCAYDTALKQAWEHDHRRIPAGAPGIEARTPVLWNQAVGVRGLDPCLFVQVSAERAARTLGLYPRKGRIAVGADADLVLWDPAHPWTGDDLRPVSPATFSLYDRAHGTGLPRHVIAAGRTVVEDRRFTGEKGAGRFLAREPRP
ncbi:amidohydrolase family protein [Herbidospora yilanensis]|uniref:amidohydrolase family protein n=1 Tax=Herbidospora yilanensis TaxID=354426 RepID=UPI000782F45D|nr:amidohydrolase family protein [Herbidospora yilanensis]